jgi:hypothetical protein
MIAADFILKQPPDGYNLYYLPRLQEVGRDSHPFLQAGGFCSVE